MSERLENSESTRHTGASDVQLEFRNRLWDKFMSAPLSSPELERSLGLFLRGSLLARLLAIDEAYRMIVQLPGQVFEFGCWRGQTSVVCENLRAIHEPFNKLRRIVAFDTFDGYAGTSSRDRVSESFHEGSYAVGGEGYAEYLRELLEIHEGNNAVPHIRNVHRVVVGNAMATVPAYLEAHPETMIALAFFDLDLYEPTKAVLRDLLDSRALVPGAVLAFFQLTRDELLPGDAIAFKEAFAGRRYTMQRSKFYSSLTFVTLHE
ncbi:MAG TPA: hypothetical protein VEA16_07685 [Vicinamibacterales bacterium]|nr:hypothetical protein [Vicinamibacterales bacterium]